jgi:hypothetical protein
MKKFILILGFFIAISLPSSASAALTDDLVSYWKFDESSGNAADAHGSNTLTNNSTIPFVSAKLNNGADLEADDMADYFSKTDTSNLSITGDMGLSMWVRLESNTDPALFNKWTSSGNQKGFYIQYTSAGLRMANSSNGSTESVGTSVTQTLSNGTWYHIVANYDASAGEAEFFVNGSSIGSSTGLATSIFDNTEPFIIGSHQGNSNFLDGVVDEVGVWNRLLSGVEVGLLYNSGTPLAYPLTPPTSSLPSIFGSGTVNVLAKFITATTVDDSLISDDGSNVTVSGGLIGNFIKVIAGGIGLDTLTSGVLSIGSTTANAINIGRSGVTTTFSGSISAGTTTVRFLNTTSNCNSSTSPASCGSAPSGSVVLASGGSTLVVNTSAVTVNSQILITEDSSLNSRLGVTCNTTTGRVYSISSRTSGTSFTITSDKNPISNGACLSYWIVN